MTRAPLAVLSSPEAPDPAAGRATLGESRGFTLIEVLIAMMILTIALVAIAGMFPVGYTQVVDAGRMTRAVAAGRQILEDVRSVPFDNLDNLNNFDSENPATLPAGGPELDFARRWRYALDGEGDGFTFTPAEIAEWQSLSPFGGRATVQVQPGATATLRQVTVTVSVDALTQSVQLITLIVRM